MFARLSFGDSLLLAAVFGVSLVVVPVSGILSFGSLSVNLSRHGAGMETFIGGLALSSLLP